MSRPITIEEMVTLFKGHHFGSHLFKIDNFSLLWKYEIGECESSIFDIGGYKWKLIVYPKGNESEKGNGHVSIYLEIQDSSSLPCNWRKMFEVSLFAVNQFRRVWKTGGVVFDASSGKWGTARLIPHTTLDDSGQGFLVDDCAMFGVKLLGLQGAKAGTAECFTLIEKPPNHKVTWKITKFSSFLPDTDHDSNEFVIGGRKWLISLYPRGSKEAEGNSVSVFLKALGHTDYALKTKTYAKFKLRILDQINRKHFERRISSYWFPAEPSRWGYRKFMSLGDFHDTSNGYLVNDMLYVGVEMDVVSITKSC